MPFILRGVNLLGINSSATPRDVRLAVWQRIATDLRPAKLDRIAHRIVSFDDLPAQFDAYLKGSVTGRTVVRIGEPGRPVQLNDASAATARLWRSPGFCSKNVADGPCLIIAG